MAIVVTRAAFDDAVVCGDLPTAQAFFAQSHVHSLLLSTNACVLETEPTDPAAFRLPNGAYPWYCRPKHGPVDNDDIPLLSAARNGHAHVVEWLFSQEHALFMGETLAFLLPLVAQYDSKREWHHAPWTSDPLVLEVLLSSRVFCDWVADHKKQSILDEIAGQCVSPAVIAIAVSHGARLHSARTVVALYGIPALRTTMAGLVSPNVLLAPSCYWESVNASDSFLTLDADDPGLGDALIHAAGSGDDDALQRLLCDGVLDVDVRDRDGKTALMHVACVDPTTDLGSHVREDRTREIAEQLCQYSDVDSVDADGWTALHYATDAANRQVANVLLASSANVSLYDHQGLVSHDYLSDTELEAAVEPYLKRGANPFWSFRREHHSWDGDDEAAQPTCLYGRLMATQGGRDFIQSNPRYFEFDAAVSSGDLATIQAFFTQPHVRTQVEETNARIVETNPTDLATFTRPDGPTPWFCRPTQDYFERIHVPLVDAARKGHVDVIQWFFSADNALRMGKTLAFLLPIVGRDRKYMSSEQSDPLVLETLLTSAVFRDAIPLERQQATLDDLARHCDSRLLIDILVAHGARLDNAQTVIKLYGKQALETTHAFFVGADVLLAPATCWGHAQADDSFLTSRRNSGSGDGDWTDRISRQLIDAARFNNLNAVDALLADGFQDVDARDPIYGMTALMNVAAFDPQLDLSPHAWDDTPSIASSLLAYCDVDLVDPLGRTALHYAAERNITVAEVLLEAGADASKRDFLGVAALDCVVDDVYGWRCWPQVMLLFLRGGADPFATRHMPGDCAEEDDLSDQEEADIGAPRSLYDRLMESETGRDFMRTHACYFRGSSLSPAQD